MQALFMCLFFLTGLNYGCTHTRQSVPCLSIFAPKSQFVSMIAACHGLADLLGRECLSTVHIVISVSTVLYKVLYDVLSLLGHLTM